MLLFVHPQFHELSNDHAVPVGAVMHMNSTAMDKAGRYALELSEEDIAQATVIALDSHWYHGVSSLQKLLKDARRINPKLKAVVGGHTASAYAAALSKLLPDTVVIRGHADLIFSQVAEALHKGEAPPTLPGVWVKGKAPGGSHGPAPAGVPVLQRSLDLSWFPTLDRLTREAHERYNPDHPTQVIYSKYFPYLPVIRGCKFTCDFCYGKYQEGVFGETRPLMRMAQEIAETLEALEKQGRRFVSALGDFLYFLPQSFVEEAFPRKFNLALDLMCCNVPPIQRLRPLLERFEHVLFEFTNPADQDNLFEHNPSLDLKRKYDQVFRTLEQLQDIPNVSIDFNYLSRKELAFGRKVQDAGLSKVRVALSTDWVIPTPDTRGLTPEKEPEALAVWLGSSERFQWGRALQAVFPEFPAALDDSPTAAQWRAHAQEFRLPQAGPFTLRAFGLPEEHPLPPTGKGRVWWWPLTVTPLTEGELTGEFRFGALRFRAKKSPPAACRHWLLLPHGPFPNALTTPGMPTYWLTLATPQKLAALSLTVDFLSLTLHTPEESLTLDPGAWSLTTAKSFIAGGPQHLPPFRSPKTAKALYQRIRKRFPAAVSWITGDSVGLRFSGLQFIIHEPTPAQPHWRLLGELAIHYHPLSATNPPDEPAVLTTFNKAMGL